MTIRLPLPLRFLSYCYEFEAQQDACGGADTLGIGILPTGADYFSGLNLPPENAACHRFYGLRLRFLHLISRPEVMTDETPPEHCELDYLKEEEREEA